METTADGVLSLNRREEVCGDEPGKGENDIKNWKVSVST